MALSELKIGHPAPKLSRARTMELFERNVWLARANKDQTLAVNTMRLDGPDPVRMARMARIASQHFIQGKRADGWMKTADGKYQKFGVHKEKQPSEPSSVAKTNRDFVPLYALHVHLHGKP